MTFQKIVCVAAFAGMVLLAGGARADDQAPAAAKSGIPRADAEAAFGKAMLLSCLLAMETGKPIADLPDTARADLRPATPEERQVSRGNGKSVQVWASQTLPGLTVTETSPQRCDVTAIQLPVEETIRHNMSALAQLRPGFHDVPQKPGYNPIVYQMEGDEAGAHYIVHMEGAEPGGFGHAFRFSLLSGWVIRQDLK
jgi:hypothetical protein